MVVVAPTAPPVDAPAVRPVDYDYVPEPVTSVAGPMDVLVDEARGQVFVAQRDAGLLVLDLEAKPITTVAMPGRQEFLTPNDDGRAVFLVASNAFGEDAATTSSILRVDAATLAVEVVAESAFDDECRFGAIEYLAGRIWYATRCPHSTGTGTFGYVDPADGSIHDVSAPDPDIDGIYAFPGRRDRLVILVNRHVQLVRIVEGSPVTVSLMATREYATFSGVAGVSPDGKEIVVAGEDGGGRRYSANGLVTLGGYEGTGEATAIAVRADGTVAIGSEWGPGLSIYRPGQFAPVRTYQLNPRNPWGAGGVVHQGLGWGAERLYAVRGNGDLYAFVPRRRPRLNADVLGRDFRYGEAVPVTVRLDGPSTGRDVVVWSVGRRGARELVGTFEVPGGRVLTINAVARRNGHFEARFAGNDEYDPTYDKTFGIRVAARVRSGIHSGRLVKGVHVHHVREPVVFRSTVLPNHAGDCLYVVVEVLSGGLWRDVTSSCATLDEHSIVIARFEGTRRTVGKRFRIRGFFFADEDNTEAAGRWLSFRFAR